MPELNLFRTYLIIINVIAFMLYAFDKLAAKRGWRRIRESTLLLLAAFGGSAGALALMYLFRHKTRHLKFKLGVPALLVLQIAGWVYLH